MDEQKPEGQNVGSNSLLGRLRDNRVTGWELGAAACEAADEIERLQADARRLDWLENENTCYWVEVQRQTDGEMIFSGQGAGLREAVDEMLTPNAEDQQDYRVTKRKRE